MTYEVHMKLPEKSYQVAVLAKNAALFVMSFVDKRERQKRIWREEFMVGQQDVTKRIRGSPIHHVPQHTQ